VVGGREGAGDGGDGAEVVAEEAGQGDAVLPIGGAGEGSHERVAASGATGAEGSAQRGRRADGDRRVERVRAGGAGGNGFDHVAVAGADGGGDRVQVGVRVGSAEREDAGGAGGGAAVEERAG
jgi:hypothetical protein